MQALDILEKRIEALSRMLGPLPDTSAAGSCSEGGKSGGVATEDLVESLLSAHTLLNGAVGDREQINKAINRTTELEKYMDPNFLEENQQLRAKEVYLNAVAPDLHNELDQLEEIKRLEPTLGAEYFRNMPSESTDKLKQFVEDNGEFAQQSELIEESLIVAMKRYGEIQAGLLESLAVMSKRLETVEEKLQKKKREELEKAVPVKDDAE